MSEAIVIRTVAVLDDNEDDREMTVFAVEAAGFTAYVLPTLDTIDNAIAEVRDNAQALVSDHNLEWADGAQFNGAALVSRCFQERIPAVLVTGFMTDVNTSIRLHRRGVAQLVERRELDGERLASALEITLREMSDSPPHTRIPHLALVRVERVDPVTGQLDVVVPQWDPRTKVSVPAEALGVSNLPANLLELRDARFFAQVNTGADEASDLFFGDAEPAGDVPDDAEFE